MVGMQAAIWVIMSAGLGKRILGCCRPAFPLPLCRRRTVFLWLLFAACAIVNVKGKDRRLTVRIRCRQSLDICTNQNTARRLIKLYRPANGRICIAPLDVCPCSWLSASKSGKKRKTKIITVHSTYCFAKSEASFLYRFCFICVFLFPSYAKDEHFVFPLTQKTCFFVSPFLSKTCIPFSHLQNVFAHFQKSH